MLLKVSARDKLLVLLRNADFTTAHYFANLLGYTPQHINRELKTLFSEGKACYIVVPHRGSAQHKRLWSTIERGNQLKQQYKVIFPEYAQEELPL